MKIYASPTLMAMKKDASWKAIAGNIPPEALRALAKKHPGHAPEKLFKDIETLVDEVHRVCPPRILTALHEEYCDKENFVCWFFLPEGRNLKELLRCQKEKATKALLAGISPEFAGEKPTLYQIQRLGKTSLFRYAARDGHAYLRVSFRDKRHVPYVNQYLVILHPENETLIVCGPTAAYKAVNLVDELSSFCRVDVDWSPCKPGRGKSREFYTALKRELRAYLVETKRDDPSGKYRTLTLESHPGKRDLERVDDFREKYLHADSYYDVLEFRHRNRLGLIETTNVKFGRIYGKFQFKAGTSLSTMRYFVRAVNEILQ